MSVFVAESPDPSPLDPPRVLVVGAGVGGLYAALLCGEKYLDVTIIEAADRVGGGISLLLLRGDALTPRVRGRPARRSGAHGEVRQGPRRAGTVPSSRKSRAPPTALELRRSGRRGDSLRGRERPRGLVRGSGNAVVPS